MVCARMCVCICGCVYVGMCVCASESEQQNSSCAFLKNFMEKKSTVAISPQMGARREHFVIFVIIFL